MTEEIIWKDPPPKANHRHEWVDRLTPLLDHPKRWAMVKVVKSPNSVQRLKRGEYVVPKGKWEFRSHQLAMGKYEVYARYLGPTEEGES